MRLSFLVPATLSLAISTTVVFGQNGPQTNAPTPASAASEFTGEAATGVTKALIFEKAPTMPEAAAEPPPAPVIPVINRVIYVAPEASSQANGLTAETPISPQRAASMSLPGDVILFAEGEYVAPEGKTLLLIENSGAPDKPITFAPHPGAKVVLRVKGGWEAIKVAGASHIVIRNFRCVGSAADVTLEEATREMSNTKSPRTCGNGIGITAHPSTKSRPSFITVRDCVVSDFPGGGIFANHVDYLTIENNVVFRCAYWSPHANSGISIYQPIDVDDNTGYKLIIRSNVCFGNYQNIPFIHSNRKDPSKRKWTDGNGIILDDFLNSQSWGGGSGKPYGGRTLIINNVVFLNGGSGIHAFKADHVDIIHNYAFDNNRHPTLKDGQIFSNTSKNVRIINNVMVAPPGKPVSSNNKNTDLMQASNVYANTDGTKPIGTVNAAENIAVASTGLELIGWTEGKRACTVTANSPLRSAGMILPDAAADFFGIPRGDGKPDIGPSVLKEPTVTTVAASEQTTFAAPAVPAAGDLNEKITLEARGHGPVTDTTRVQQIEGPEPGSSAIQVTIPEGTEGKKFRVNAKGEIAGEILANEPVTLTFMARSPGSNRMLVMIHTAASPDRVKLMSDTNLTPEWKSYSIKGEKPQAFAPGEAIVDFMMGAAPGVIEISDVLLSK